MRQEGIDGPLFLGADTHALSAPATASALEVFAANDVTVLVDARDGYTPTPALSRAILDHNAAGPAHRADGVVVTPSHNPPTDGGFKYNPPDGGPAGTEITKWIQDRANEILAQGMAGVRRIPYARAREAAHTYDFLDAYVGALPRIIDLDAIRSSGVRIGADPLGGASVDYWGEIGSRYGLDLSVVNPLVDRTFRFMTLDWDGKIRMDCSSPSAMASLIARQTTSTSRPATTPTPTGTASSRRTRADEPEPLPRRRDLVPLRPSRRTGRATRRSARRWSARP